MNNPTVDTFVHPLKIVRLQEKYTFKLFRLDREGRLIVNTLLRLDFNPLINYFGLDSYGDFVLIHYQAKPINERNYGVLDGLSGNYYSCPIEQTELKLPFPSVLLRIDESDRIIPNAALALAHARASVNHKTGFIEVNRNF